MAFRMGRGAGGRGRRRQAEGIAGRCERRREPGAGNLGETTPHPPRRARASPEARGRFWRSVGRPDGLGGSGVPDELEVADVGEFADRRRHGRGPGVGRWGP